MYCLPENEGSLFCGGYIIVFPVGDQPPGNSLMERKSPFSYKQANLLAVLLLISLGQNLSFQAK